MLRQLWLIPVILLAACASPSTGPVSLSGSVTGLDAGTSAYLRLEQLTGDQVPGQGQTITRFSVTDGPWEQTGLALEPGQYGLVPEAQGYVSRLGTLTFPIVSADGTWDYRHLDFELFRPEQAPERVGVPLCSEPPPGGGVYVYVGPEGRPTPTPTFVPVSAAVTASAPLWPPGTCYAGQYQHPQYWSIGIQGVVSGLPSGQAADILVYVLPPVMGEAYFVGEPLPPDGSWHHPEALTALETAPQMGMEETLALTLTVSNGPWGVLDPGLRGHKYLVLAQAPGLTAAPPAYEVVVFDGKINWPSSGVDFVFAPK